jgi:hypothetical protein
MARKKAACIILLSAIFLGAVLTTGFSKGAYTRSAQFSLISTQVNPESEDGVGWVERNSRGEVYGGMVPAGLSA